MQDTFTSISFRTDTASNLSNAEFVKIQFSDDQIAEIKEIQEYLKSLNRWGQLRIELDNAELFDCDDNLINSEYDNFLNISADYVYYYAQDTDEASIQIESDVILFGK